MLIPCKLTQVDSELGGRHCQGSKLSTPSSPGVDLLFVTDHFPTQTSTEHASILDLANGPFMFGGVSTCLRIFAQSYGASSALTNGLSCRMPRIDTAQQRHVQAVRQCCCTAANRTCRLPSLVIELQIACVGAGIHLEPCNFKSRCASVDALLVCTAVQHHEPPRLS